jgi:hypothetical protein
MFMSRKRWKGRSVKRLPNGKIPLCVFDFEVCKRVRSDCQCWVGKPVGGDSSVVKVLFWCKRFPLDMVRSIDLFGDFRDYVGR